MLVQSRLPLVLGSALGSRGRRGGEDDPEGRLRSLSLVGVPLAGRGGAQVHVFWGVGSRIRNEQLRLALVSCPVVVCTDDLNSDLPADVLGLGLCMKATGL